MLTILEPCRDCDWTHSQSWGDCDKANPRTTPPAKFHTINNLGFCCSRFFFYSGQSGDMTSSAVDGDPSANIRLTGENLKIAMELKDDEEKSRMLQALIYTNPYEGDTGTTATKYKDYFFSHRGPDTKKALVQPLQRTLKDLYDIDGFVDSLPLGENLNDDKEDVLRRSH
jgi:hypothetical protein